MAPATQPFTMGSELESADEEGTSLHKGGSGLLLGGLSKKRRTQKHNDKAFSYKKVDFEGAIRRSERIKDKGGMTESEGQ